MCKLTISFRELTYYRINKRIDISNKLYITSIILLTHLHILPANDSTLRMSEYGLIESPENETLYYIH